jgi:hypothetical protein
MKTFRSDWNFLAAIGRVAPMPLSTHRTLKRRGRVVLVETANPATGIGYSVRIGALALWTGDNISEAERQFEQATK